MNVCSAMDYAHSNSVLHLNLYPSKVLWTAQDFIETQVYRIANPSNRAGILLTDFGNLMIFDMEHQNYSFPSSKAEMNLIDQYWPPDLRDKFKKLLQIQRPADQLKPSFEFAKQHTQFLQSLSQKVDLFLFGGLLLYILNNGMTWKDCTDLNPAMIDKLVDIQNDFFEQKIYERIKMIIKRCFLAADTNYGDIGFVSFYEISRTLDQDFGYFVTRIESVHTQPQRQDINPSKELPITVFRNHMSAFYNDFYFGNYDAAFKHFRQAKKIRSQLGKGNEAALDSFEFNNLMLNWIQGKISATDVTTSSAKCLSTGLFAHENTYKNLHQAVKLLPTVQDAKFITTFENMFRQLVENYVYKDCNKKHTLINSGDKSSVSHVLVSSQSSLFVIGTFQAGVHVYSMNRELKSSYSMEGLTALAGGGELSIIIIGTNFGIVYVFEIHKATGKIDEKSFKQLYKHEGKVKVVEMALSGSIAMSYGYLDNKLVLYDIDVSAVKQVIDMSTKPGGISSFAFDGKGNRTFYSMENSLITTLTDYLAPVHRRETTLEVIFSNLGPR